MTFRKDNFVEPPVIVNKDILGIGKTKAVMMGTIKYAFEDDNGNVDQFIVPNCYCSEDIPIRLFSPQHWAQSNRRRNAHSDTNADRITLEWDDRKCTVPLNLANIGILCSASGYRKSKSVLSALTALLPDDPHCFPAHLIPSDEDDDEPTHVPTSEPVSVHPIQDFPTVTTVSKGTESDDDLPDPASDDHFSL
jgi:hypothetical protein